MPSPNPLTRTTPFVHLPLIVLSTLFALPLLWLLLTSVQPREQVGKVPPEWLPRQFYIEVGSETVPVTPPLTVGTDKLLVVPSAGPQRGQHLLVAPAAYQNGMLVQRTQSAAGMTEATYPARLERAIPEHFVIVKEWFLSKYTKRAARTFYLEPSAVKQKVSPVTGNYPEAVRALTARGSRLATRADKRRTSDRFSRKTTALPWLGRTAWGLGSSCTCRAASRPLTWSAASSRREHE